MRRLLLLPLPQQLFVLEAITVFLSLCNSRPVLKQSMISLFTALCDGLVFSVGSLILIIDAVGTGKPLSAIHSNINAANAFPASFFHNQPFAFILSSTSASQLVYHWDLILFPLMSLRVQPNTSMEVLIALGASAFWLQVGTEAGLKTCL